ncbi:MAG: ribosome silencing factor [Pyrinomonadaceae bacterium]
MKQNLPTPENTERINASKTTTPARKPATASVEATATTAAATEQELDERMITALRAAADKKAIDPLVLDLRPIANFTDFFLITSGANIRQVQAIADEIVERLKRRGNAAQRVEGYAAAEWVLVDYGDFVVHIFEDKARHFYDLERLWREAARVELKPEMFAEPRTTSTDER